MPIHLIHSLISTTTGPLPLPILHVVVVVMVSANPLMEKTVKLVPLIARPPRPTVVEREHLCHLVTIQSADRLFPHILLQLQLHTLPLPLPLLLLLLSLGPTVRVVAQLVLLMPIKIPTGSPALVSTVMLIQAVNIA